MATDKRLRELLRCFVTHPAAGNERETCVEWRAFDKCRYCGSRAWNGEALKHESDCLIVQARAALAEGGE